jgi:hypothetical protein
MSLIKEKSPTPWLALLFLVLPTVLITYPFLGLVADYFELLHIPKFMLLAVFAVGAGASFILHGFKIRFLILSALAVGVVYFGNEFLKSSYVAEFDAYYIASRYQIYATVFLVAWFLGFGLLKFRYFPIFYAVLVATLGIIALSQNTGITVEQVTLYFFPIVLYALYLPFVKELIESEKDRRFRAVGVLLKRTFVFVIFAGLAYFLSLELVSGKTDALKEAIRSNQTEEKEGGENNMLEKDKDKKSGKEGQGDFSLKDYAKIDKKLSQSPQLLFAAYLDNKFLGTDIPNPLYFTGFHLNQYDVESGKFQVDTLNPFLDTYNPNPSEIPLYFKDVDSSFIESDITKLFPELATTEIYFAGLSAKEFIAPSTAFSCQPIAVDEDFKDQFHFAYKAQSLISSLNSAYMIVKSDDPTIKKFQNFRHAQLRTVKDYSKVDSAFMEYYTRVPKGKLFDRIDSLGKAITKGKKAPIDKALALSDFFWSKDEFGKPNFEYNLIPGYDNVETNIPNSEMLGNFLFKTGKGYCTYYAGSSLFILRSLGIPARMTTGFITLDRSSNNPGWYWFYGNQAHAWTQVYFPKYGWLDFDFTIGDPQDEHPPEQTDGTPPVVPRKAHFAGNGVVVSVDTANFQIDVKLHGMMWQDEEARMEEETISLKLDAKNATYLENKEASSIMSLETGDSLIAISYDKEVVKIKRKRSDNANSLLERSPNPFPVSEIHFKKEKEVEEEPEKEAEEEPQDIQELGIYFAGLAGLLLLFALLYPYIYHRYLIGKINGSNNARDKAYHAYRHAFFALNQFGYSSKLNTPKEFAQYSVDPKFSTSLASFVDIYLKTKYSPEQLNSTEETVVEAQHPDFYKSLFEQHTAKQRFLNFLRLDRTLQFIFGVES